MKKNKKKGFTLVELLAVIVILAIILVIAVPKIMETIKNAKIDSMESSAKLIAKSVETNYQVSLASGEGGTLSLTGSCLDSKFVDIDLNEYESCTYTITDGKAKITLKGKSTGKFAGLICTDATKTSATCEKDSTSDKLLTNVIKKSLIHNNNSNESGIHVYKYNNGYYGLKVKILTTITNYEKCVNELPTLLGEFYDENGNSDNNGFSKNDIITLCSGNKIDTITLSSGNTIKVRYSYSISDLFGDIDASFSDVSDYISAKNVLEIPTITDKTKCKSDLTEMIEEEYVDAVEAWCNGYTYTGFSLIDLIEEGAFENEPDYVTVNYYDLENISGYDYRYFGPSPLNYVKFDGEDELWRIIGIIDGKVKLIRNEPFDDGEGNYVPISWGFSEENVNNGFGVNEWSYSKLNTLLNDYYYGESETCFFCFYFYTVGSCEVPCESFISKLSLNTKKMIDENATWYTGAWDGVLEPYKSEHITGKKCQESESCNDTIERKTMWNGAVGLMSLSDYLYSLESGSFNYYNEDSWLDIGEYQWTITPYADSEEACNVIGINNEGGVGSSDFSTLPYSVRPSVFLKPNVYVSSGTGSMTDPYILKM